MNTTSDDKSGLLVKLCSTRPSSGGVLPIVINTKKKMGGGRYGAAAASKKTPAKSTMRTAWLVPIDNLPQYDSSNPFDPTSPINKEIAVAEDKAAAKKEKTTVYLPNEFFGPITEKQKKLKVEGCGPHCCI